MAHSLSVIVVQADGAAAAAEQRPARRRPRRSRTIGDTGREALGQMRRLLGVLRTEPPGGDALAPQPGDRSARGAR